MSALNAACQIILWCLPWTIRRLLLSSLCGLRTSNGARIGFSVVLCKRVQLGQGARIGHLNIIKGLEVLDLGDRAIIGNGNWITGIGAGRSTSFRQRPGRHSALIMGADSALTHRHIVDCTDTVRIGAFSTIAGWRSQILTHSINLFANEQTCGPTTVGSHCFVGTGCVILNRAKLADRSVLCAGSSLALRETKPGVVYAGVPAAPIAEVSDEALYFKRLTGVVA